MRRMDVAHFESGPIPRQTAWSQRRKPTLMRQLSQRIGLIHELRKLRATKEIANDRAERLGIDQLLRSHPVDVDVEQSHALFHQALRSRQTDAALIGQQLSDGANAPAPQMIDIIERAFATA